MGHCEILGSYLQQPHQHHVFRAHFEAEPHSQAEANKWQQIFCLIYRYKLIDSLLSIFLEKLIGQWIPDRNGRGIARDIKKNYFHFQNATKTGNKVGTIYKVGTFKLLKLSKLCYHFLSSFENGNIFFDIPSNPPPIVVRNSLTNQFVQIDWRFCIFSTTKK